MHTPLVICMKTPARSCQDATAPHSEGGDRVQDANAPKV